MKPDLLENFENWSKNLDGTCLLAVSGGRDSMCLWYLFHHFKLPYAIAHVNYGLRGKESELDQALVEKIAKERGVEYFIKKLDDQEVEKLQSSSIQDTARKIRYDWFYELRRKHAYPILCTAHHLDDQLETFFINLSRGAGLQGLKGINSDGELQRPLLRFSREEISAFVAENHIEFRDDKSNESDDYLRNWLRNGLIKDWKIKDPSFAEKATQSIHHINSSQQLLDHFLELEINKLNLSPSLPINIPIEEFKEQKLFVELVYKISSDYGFSRFQISDLYSAWKGQNVGAHINAGNFQILLDRDQLILHERIDLDFDSMDIPKEGIEIEEPTQLKIDMIQRDQVELGKDNTQYLDANSLSFPLKLRRWKEGDRMQPLGMKGSKKISDLLIDSKISMDKKGQTFVLLSDERIASLIGVRIAELFKLNEDSQEVLRIQW